MKRLILLTCCCFVLSLIYTSGLLGQSAEITTIDPNMAVQESTVNVAISGVNTHFDMGSGTSIWFQQSSSTIYPNHFLVNSPTEINAEFSFDRSDNPGYYDVYVNDHYDPILSLPSGFRLWHYQGRIVLVDPDQWPAPGNIRVDITGEETVFTPGSGTAYMKLERDQEQIAASFTEVNSSTFLQAYLNLPSGAEPGFWDVAVYMYDRPLPVVLEDGFEIISSDTAAIVAVVPDSAHRGDNLDVDITGYRTHFEQGTMTLIQFRQGSSTINYNNYNVYSYTHLTANFDIPTDANIGWWELWVGNGFETVRKLDAFRIDYLCGDANTDNSVDISDAIFLINYIFLGGAAPLPYESGEVNCDGKINLVDVVYIVNYVFVNSSMAPCDPNQDGIPDC